MVKKKTDRSGHNVRVSPPYPRQQSSPDPQDLFDLEAITARIAFRAPTLALV